MGEDKSQLIYQNNLPEWKRLHGLLAELCDEVYLCHREDQDYGEQSIIDPGDGPLRAIHSAQKAKPEVAWLVLACDMPLVDITTLRNLVENRDPSKSATCYLSPIDKQAEPLCTIYEPSIAESISEGVTENRLCPRTYLKNAHSISPLSPNSLLNANSAADKVEVFAILNGSQTQKSISVQYFAQLKDITKKDIEKLNTNYETSSGLFEQLKSKYQFPYKQKDLMLAINDEFAEWQQLLEDGDNVVFIPPVAGG